MAFGKKHQAQAAAKTFTMEEVAALIAQAQGGTKPKGKVGRPPKVKDEQPEATCVAILDGDRENFVNIVFTDDQGEPAKPDEETLKTLKFYGFQWAPSKRQWYGIAQAVPRALCEAAEFNRPEMD